MKTRDLETEVIEVIAQSGGNELFTDAAELGLDQLLEDGIVKDIPVIGSLAKLYKAGVGVKGYLFVRKLQKFLFSLKDIPDKERQKFSERMDSNKAFRKRVGENLLLILDRLDDMGKPELTARAFKGFMREEYDFYTFQRLAAAVERCLVLDFEWLRSESKGRESSPHVALSLSAVGLVELEAIPTIRTEKMSNKYKVTDLGKLFLQVVLEGGHRED